MNCPAHKTPMTETYGGWICLTKRPWDEFSWKSFYPNIPFSAAPLVEQFRCGSTIGEKR